MQTYYSFKQETFPQLRAPQEDLDGIGTTGEEYRRALRFVILLLYHEQLNNQMNIIKVVLVII